MNFIEILQFSLMIVEAAALLGAIAFGIKALKEKKYQDVKKSLLTQGAIYLVVFAVLCFIRFKFFQ